jgi:hypothetical protein
MCLLSILRLLRILLIMGHLSITINSVYKNYFNPAL